MLILDYQFIISLLLLFEFFNKYELSSKVNSLKAV